MAKVLSALTSKPKGSAFNIVDAGLISLSKSLAVDAFITPQILNRVTGGSAPLNVVGKLIGAGLIGSMVGGRIGNVIGTSMVISAGDEIVGSILGIGNNQTPAGAPRSPAGDDTFGQANRGEGIVRFI